MFCTGSGLRSHRGCSVETWGAELRCEGGPELGELRATQQTASRHSNQSLASWHNAGYHSEADCGPATNQRAEPLSVGGGKRVYKREQPREAHQSHSSELNLETSGHYH